MRNLLILISFFAYSVAHAQQVGEIVSVSPDGVIRFYIGREIKDLAVGEELRVTGHGGASDRFIVVKKIDPPFAEAEVSRFVVRPHASIEPIRRGQRVKLEVDRNTLHALSFLLGSSLAPKTGDYGGSNGFLGLSGVWGYSEKYFFSFRLQADSLGSTNGIEKRRSAYMFGVGTRFHGAMLSAYLGIIDSMTINERERDAGGSTIDPYSGAAYPTKGVHHKNEWGYMLAAQYPIWISKVSRNSKFGWSISPTASYGDVFGASDYKGYFSLGAAVDLWFD